ncbi:MAG: CmcI family methyltransferase [Deltaproteobacteria bacterium]|nr:CmcI family methyltransferase [Deltaproteobacteria bacterium]
MNIAWLTAAAPLEHLYKHRWLGERFFHLPGDMVALQEILVAVKPGLVIHSGVAAGGGPIFLASILELIGDSGRHGGTPSVVAAIDPKLRDEGRKACTEHALARRIMLFEGSSIDDNIVEQLRPLAKDRGPVVVVLDLIHTHDHVKRELELLGELVTPGSFVVVLDTVMEDLPAELFAGRPYGKGNNPGTAVKAFLAEDRRFVVDYSFEDRVLLTLAPGGFLRRLPD